MPPSAAPRRVRRVAMSLLLAAGALVLTALLLIIGAVVGARICARHTPDCPRNCRYRRPPV